LIQRFGVVVDLSHLGWLAWTHLFLTQLAGADPALWRGGGFVSSRLAGLDAPILDSACRGGLVTSRSAILDGPVLDSAPGGGLFTPRLVGSHARLLNWLVRSVDMCLGPSTFSTNLLGGQDKRPIVLLFRNIGRSIALWSPSPS
jgi:hypothetical protein